MMEPVRHRSCSVDSSAPASRAHRQILGHDDHGATELRVFDPISLVAHTDNDEDAIRLALEIEGKTSGIYVGVQPRPLHLFDYAPNCCCPAKDMKEHDVMTLAGHSTFETTHRFYLAVADDLVDRARLATPQGLCQRLARSGARPILSQQTIDRRNRKLLNYKDLRLKRP